jgi:hypothetical protein
MPMQIVAHGSASSQQVQQQDFALPAEGGQLLQQCTQQGVLQMTTCSPPTAAAVEVNVTRKDSAEMAAARRLDAAAEAAAHMGCAAVASLAVWQGVHVALMARRLLHMQPEEQKELIQRYAAAMRDSSSSSSSLRGTAGSSRAGRGR